MLNRDYVEKILDYILSKGADFAEIFYEDTDRNEFSMNDERLARTLSYREQGIGIQFYKGNKSNYLFSSDVGESNVLQLLKQSLGSVNNCGSGWKYGDAVKQHQLNPIRIYPGDVAKERKIALLQKGIKSGHDYDERIMQARGIYRDIDQRVLIANTEGTFAEDRRTKTRIMFQMFAGEEGRSSYYGPGAMQGFEFYDEINIDKMAGQIAEDALQLLGAGPCPAGEMPVIIGNGFGGLFVHEACGHTLEAANIRKAGSEFENRIGEKIASSKVTLVDDGSIRGAWGSSAIDDEGMPTQKNILIDKGVLKTFLSDRHSAMKTGIERNGSARRESYRFAPISRMSNTYVAQGTDKLSDMIASVEKGLYVKSIWAGSVMPPSGEFNFKTGETFLIENGKIVGPVNSATLIGRGSDILRKIEMVGDDFQMGEGNCYAESGALTISAGQPSIKISKMTVGGDTLVE